MTDDIKDGGPAFPNTVSQDERIWGVDFHGMSLRDWFAGQAIRFTMQINDHNINDFQSRQIAKFAYMIADAMLKARDATND